MTFRARLTIFLVTIVLTPLAVLAVAGSRVGHLESEGHLDGRLEGASFGVTRAMNDQVTQAAARLTPALAKKAHTAAIAGRPIDEDRTRSGLDYLVVVDHGKVVAWSARSASFLPGVSVRPAILAGEPGRAGLVADRHVSVAGRRGADVWGGLFRDAGFLRTLPLPAMTVAGGRVVASTVLPAPVSVFGGTGARNAGDGWRGLCLCAGTNATGVVVLARPAQVAITGGSLRLLIALGVALGAMIAFGLVRLLTDPLQRLADGPSERGRPARGGNEVMLVDAAVDAMSKALSEKERLSLVDPLTGCWNRRYLDISLAAELGRVHRYGHPFTVLLVDVDGFKGVNDAHGHRIGDAVLRALVQRLVGSIRTNVDVLTRMGGDAFVIVLPETPLDRGRVVARKAVELVRREPFRPSGLELALTVSVGIAAYPESGATAEALLAAAGDALDRAKAGGRDRTEGPEGPAKRQPPGVQGGAPAA